MWVHSLQTMGTTEGQFNADICRILPVTQTRSICWSEDQHGGVITVTSDPFVPTGMS